MKRKVNTGKGGKIHNNGTILKRGGTGRGFRLFWLSVLAGLYMLCASCGRKEPVALETEEIVNSEQRPASENGGLTPEGDVAQSGILQEQTGGEKAAGPASEDITRESGAWQEQTAGNSAPESSLAGDDAAGSRGGQASALYVHICGAVNRPGVYELIFGSRVYEAVEKAGGFTGEADESYVNLSLLLEDGWKIEIPTLEETKRLTAQGSGGDQARKDSAAQPGITTAVNGTDNTAGSAGADAEAADKVNINTASAQALCGLPGIGESRAQSIIAYREKNGGFSRIEDIMKIEGIKEGMFSKLKDRICVR